MKSKHNILSLDGGGTWALIEVKTLMAIYGDITGHEVLSKFDLVTANSGGSIVLGSLACNWKLSEILEFFTNSAKRNKIFVTLPWYKKLLRPIGFGPKYSTTSKLSGLRNLFNSASNPIGDVLLIDLPRHIGLNNVKFLIISYDYDLQRSHFFRSDPGSKLANFFSVDRETTLAEAVHASSNAPINYFNKPARFGNKQYWDGGIGGYNNPILAGVNELLSYGISRDSINVLSLGTGHVSLPLSNGVKAIDKCLIQPRRGKFPQIKDDLTDLITSILDDPPDADMLHAHMALTQELPSLITCCPLEDGPIVRMSPLIRPVKDIFNGCWSPPNFDYKQDLKIFKKIINIPMDAMKDEDIKLIEQLTDAWIANRIRNQPIRWRENADVGCEIGHDSFGEAKLDWLQKTN